MATDGKIEFSKVGDPAVWIDPIYCPISKGKLDLEGLYTRPGRFISVEGAPDVEPIDPAGD